MGRALEPARLEILVQAFASTFSPESTFFVAAESASGVKQVRTINPNDSGFQLRGDLQSYVDAFAPNAGREPIHSIVSKLHGFTRRSKSHRGQHRAENFLLGYG